MYKNGEIVFQYNAPNRNDFGNNATIGFQNRSNPDNQPTEDPNHAVIYSCNTNINNIRQKAILFGNPTCPNHRAIAEADTHFTSFTGEKDKIDLNFVQDGYYNLIVEKNHCLVINMHIVSYFTKGYGHQFIDEIYIQYWSENENTTKKKCHCE